MSHPYTLLIVAFFSIQIPLMVWLFIAEHDRLIISSLSVAVYISFMVIMVIVFWRRHD